MTISSIPGNAKITSMILFSNVFLIAFLTTNAVEYGVDVSFPMHHPNVSTNYENLPHNTAPAGHPTPSMFKDIPIQPLGDRQAVYTSFMKGCTDTFSAEECWDFESGRLEMSLRQPASMVNYTALGFQKVKTPDRLWQAIRNFWEKNKDRQEKEEWPDGNTYANHWSSPTYLVRIVEEKGLRGEGQVLAQSIWEATRNIMQEWCKQELEEVSMYGIRVYTEGSMLNPHVDQLPYVMSAVINIAQDVDEDWPFEVIGHDGQAYNVTMKPGEMILYESHSILHGRPFSLQGRYYANVFVHFEPTGHSMKYHGYDGSDKKNGGQQTRMTRNKQIGGHEIEGHRILPPYIVPHSAEDERYREEHPDTYSYGVNSAGSSHAHIYASLGKKNELVDLIEDQIHLVHSKDKNGWTPLHEASRAGQVETAKYLIEKGAKMNERFLHGQGGTALFLAGQYHGVDSEIYKYLKSLGAVWLEPDQEL